MHHWQEEMEIFFQVRCIGTKKKRTIERAMWWSIEKLVRAEPLTKFTLFAHFWTECDSTSSIHKQGKVKVLRTLKTRSGKSILLAKSNNGRYWKCRSPNDDQDIQWKRK